MSDSSQTVARYDPLATISPANYRNATSLADAVSVSSNDVGYASSERERFVSVVSSNSAGQDGLETIHLVETHTSEGISGNSRLVALNGAQGSEMETFRLLAARLRHLQAQTQLKLLHLSSSVENEGKSVISANLALTLARSMEKVLLIEGDLRRPCFNRLLGLNNGRHGLVDYLAGDEPITNVVSRLKNPPLWVLPAGESLASPLDLLQSQRLSNLVKIISGIFDWVIIDSPPLIPFADANVWARFADGTLLVVRPGVTPKKVLQRATSSPDKLKLVGVVVNDSSVRDQYGSKEPWHTL